MAQIKTRFERDAQSLKAHVQFLAENKKTFKIAHGTYTTKIITEHGDVTYETTQFSQRVFIAAKMIKKDVLASEIGRKAIEGTYSKQNFGFHKNLVPFTSDVVLNLDISSAYATCLLVNGLITQKTFEYLKTLKKAERLPSVGMLATSRCNWVYENGVCIDINVERADTANVFFYLINEINYIMRSIEWELGKHFFFYWVDGVFFNSETPKRLVTSVEKILIDNNYRYKYENVHSFVLKKDFRDICTIEMVKNDEFKRYQFSAKKDSSDIRKQLHEIANNHIT